MTKEMLSEFKSYLWKRWLIDTVVRVLKTGAEVALGMFSIGLAWHEIDFLHILSVTGVAMLYTVLFNVHRITSDIIKANEMGVQDHADMGCSDKTGTE